jgi:hypothetical protein
MNRIGRRGPRLAVALLASCWHACLDAQPRPVIEVDAPPALAAERARVESFDLRRLAGIVRLVGLDAPGAPILVVLEAEDSTPARAAPSWVAGFADGQRGIVVLFPSRSPVYPDDTLEDVLRHEVAHVLIDRAAGGQPVPRWFHEGLAMAAERPWGLRDRTRLIAGFALGSPVGTSEMNALFTRDRAAQAQAYALAGAFVHDLLAEHGAGLPAVLLARVSAGVPFDRAFAEVTGEGLSDAERAFWRRQRLWTTWIPVLTSASALWLGVTLLALVAIRTRRRKSAAIRKRWAEEEAATLPSRPSPPAGATPRDPDARGKEAGRDETVP